MMMTFNMMIIEPHLKIINILLFCLCTSLLLQFPTGFPKLFESIISIRTKMPEILYDLLLK